jgi:hypothetical protein
MIESTEFKFTLPKGLLDKSGRIYQQGIIRLATGHDEVYVKKHPQVKENPAYAMLVMLSRVIVIYFDRDLSSFTQDDMTTKSLEGLFLIDLLYLRDFFVRIHQPVEVTSPGEF